MKALSFQAAACTLTDHLNQARGAAIQEQDVKVHVAVLRVTKKGVGRRRISCFVEMVRIEQLQRVGTEGDVR